MAKAENKSDECIELQKSIRLELIPETEAEKELVEKFEADFSEIFGRLKQDCKDPSDFYKQYGHYFFFKLLAEYYKYGQQCPICKQRIVNADKKTLLCPICDFFYADLVGSHHNEVMLYHLLKRADIFVGLP
jgi:hypothetical protein